MGEDGRDGADNPGVIAPALYLRRRPRRRPG